MIEDNSEEIGEVSGEMVWVHSEELGMIAGRPMNNVDYGQALCELTGEPKLYAKQASLESVPEAGHDQVPRAAKASEKRFFPSNDHPAVHEFHQPTHPHRAGSHGARQGHPRDG